jgi:hypothetical protein
MTDVQKDVAATEAIAETVAKQTAAVTAMSDEADKVEKLVIAQKEHEHAEVEVEETKKAAETAIAEEEDALIMETTTQAAAIVQEELATNLYAAADVDTTDLEKLRLADEAQLLADKQFEEAR